MGAGAGIGHPLNNSTIPTGRSATANVYLKKPSCTGTSASGVENVPSPAGGCSPGERDLCTNNHIQERMTFKLERKKSPRAVIFRIPSLPGNKGGSRDGRDGARRKGWTDISQQYIPGEQLPLFRAG